MFSWIAMASGLDWRLITHMVVVGTHWLLTSDMQATLSLVVSVSMGQVSCARISERETPITTEVASPTMFSHSTSVFLMGRDYSLLPRGSCGLLAGPTTLPNGTTIVPVYCVYSATGDMDGLGVRSGFYLQSACTIVASVILLRGGRDSRANSIIMSFALTI